LDRASGEIIERTRDNFKQTKEKLEKVKKQIETIA
jgi:hypothetical protein